MTEATLKEGELKVLSYNRDYDYHVCTDHEGRRRFVDVIVDGALHENGETYESVVGKIVRYESTTAYIEIAHGVSLVEQSKGNRE